MAFHTRSFFIASLGMFEIICSFPVALFIYKLIYRIEYLGNDKFYPSLSCWVLV